MNYVFFDIECANCLNGEGKICSFGYVKTDESFQVLKKKDILINPMAEFLLGNVRTGEGIHLAYPLFKFQRQFTFPHYYKEIKELLEDKENMCFGFAVFQDVSYLSYTCKRYSLPVMEFEFYDIQRLEKEINSRKNISGLDALVKEYHLTSYTYHRSDDDALMSMEVLRELLSRNHLTMRETIEKYPDFKDDTIHFLKEEMIRKRNRAIKKQRVEKIRAFFDQPHARFNINLYNPNLYKKVFFFEYELLYDEIDYFMKNKEVMEEHGMIFTRNPEYAMIVLLKDKSHHLHLSQFRKDILYMSFDELKKELAKKGH